MKEYISKEEFVSHYRKLLCEDCPRRKAYRNGKIINRFIYEIGGPPCRACDIDDMLDRVEDFIPADVAPVRHGEWVVHHDDDDDPHFIHEWYVCSCCGGEALYRRGGYEQVKTKDCPWCGAEMEATDGTT